MMSASPDVSFEDYVALSGEGDGPTRNDDALRDRHESLDPDLRCLERAHPERACALRNVRSDGRARGRSHLGGRSTASVGRDPDGASATAAARLGKGGQMTISHPEAPVSSGLNASKKARVSSGVLYIFQFPAITFVLIEVVLRSLFRFQSGLRNYRLLSGRYRRAWRACPDPGLCASPRCTQEAAHTRGCDR